MAGPGIDTCTGRPKDAVTAELPGIDPDKDVEITIEGDVLLIKGSKTAEEKSRRRTVTCPSGTSEASSGGCSFLMVDADSIVATYDKGVLTVRVPMPTETEQMTVKVPIKTG